MSIQRLLFTGMPGSGKSTQAYTSCFPQLDKERLLKGVFLPAPLKKEYPYEETLFLDLIEKSVKQISPYLVDYGYILDGLATDLKIARFIVTKGLANTVINFTIPEEEAIRRLSKELEDDQPIKPLSEEYKKRFEEYHKRTAPAINYLKKYSASDSNLKYFDINASKPQKEIHIEIIQILRLLGDKSLHI